MQSRRLPAIGGAAMAALVAGVVAAQAQDATWVGGNAGDPNEWVENNNWTATTVPTGTATFGPTGVTSVVNDNGIVTISAILFTINAQAYTITVDNPFIINGVGVTNNSPNTQAFSITDGNSIVFQNGSSANSGTGAVTYSNSGFLYFYNTSNAGNANTTITNNEILQFSDGSSGGSATIINNDETDFFNSATAGSAMITNAATGTLTFNNSATAGTAMIDNSGGLQFNNSSTGGSANITNESTGTITFSNTATAGGATITTENGGSTIFLATSSGGMAAFLTNMGGRFDISGLTSGGTTAGSIAGAGDYFLGGNTLTAGGNGASTTVSGVISDGGLSGGTGGALTKVGGGTLILTNTETYTGATTVNGGTLQIDGDSHTSAQFDVGNGGTLSGVGTTSSVFNTSGGIVAPGDDAIGMLSVFGNYTQGSTSTLRILVTPTTASRIGVGGTASLAGTLALVYAPGAYTPMTYPIVTSSSLMGAFSMLTGTPPSGLAQSVDYNYVANEADLVLSKSASLAPTGATVFSALGTAALLGGQWANWQLLDHNIDSQGGTAGVQSARAASATTQLAFAGGPQGQGFDTMLAALPDTMAQIDGGWFRAAGNFASFTGHAGAPGFDTQGGGFLAGIDRPLSENFLAGIAGGYGHTDLTEHGGGSGTLDTPRVALYGSYMMGPWSFDATAGYAHDFISASRPIPAMGATASSSYGGDEITGAAQAMYRLDWNGMTFLPAVGVNYVHLFEGAFGESGAPGFNLSVARRDSDSLRPFIGATAAKTFTTGSGIPVTGKLDLVYSHELMNAAPSDTVQVGGGSFTVNGLVPSRDQVTVGGGISAQVTNRLVLFTDYHAALPTGNFFNQTVEAGLRYRF